MAEQTSKADRVKLNRELAQMLKGGVIMDVTTPEQARIAEEAGACAVMALERIPADIRAAGGVSRMSDPKMIKGIQEAVSIPVMAKCRIGHIVEAQVLQAIEIDYIDESEVLSPADDVYHIDKTQFDVPFVCGARDLGEALRRVAEGATMIRTKGEPGTGDVVQAVRHMRKIQKQIRDVVALRDDELFEAAKQLQVPVELVREVHRRHRRRSARCDRSHGQAHERHGNHIERLRAICHGGDAGGAAKLPHHVQVGHAVEHLQKVREHIGQGKDRDGLKDIAACEVVFHGRGFLAWFV